MIKKMVKILLFIFSFLLFSMPSNQVASAATNSGLFLPYEEMPTGSWPEAVAIGDINGDGLNDVAMTTSHYSDPENDYRIHVFLQNTNGSLNEPVKYQVNGIRPESIDIGDLNNDGRADIVVGNFRKNIEVFLQNESGGLEAGVVYPAEPNTTDNSYSVKIGDVNNDHLMDIVAISWGTDNNSVDVYLQNSQGLLDSPVTYTVEHGGYDEVDVGDINGDGLTDIIVMSGQGLTPNIGVLIQESSGTFAPAVYYDVNADELTSGVAVGDVNNDSLEDIVVTYGGNKPNSFIGIFNQNSAGTLDPDVSYPAYDIPESVELGDFNLDGKQDIAVLHSGWNKAGVYLQDDDGTFLPYELYSIPYASYQPQGLAVGDINADGLDDLAIADYNHGLVILYGAPPVVLSTDPVNGASDVSVAKSVYINFSKDIQPGANFDGISISSNNMVVDYTYSINGNSLILDPISNLNQGVAYNVYLPAGAVEDLAGNGLDANFNFNFTTIDSGIGVISNDPVCGAQNVSIDKTITITFDTTVQQSVYFDDITLFKDEGSATVVDYTYSLNDNVLTVTPSSNLNYSSNYLLYIPEGAVANNVYDTNKMLILTFTTEAAPSNSGGNSDSTSSNTDDSSSTNDGVDLTDSTTSTTTTEDDQSVTTVVVDEETAQDIIDQNSDANNVVIPVEDSSDVVNAKLPVGLIVSLAKKSSTVEIKTSTGSYVLPASEINAAELSKQLGVNEDDVEINIVIAKPKPQQTAAIEKFIGQHNLTQIVEPVEFRVEGIAGENKVEIKEFDSFVSRKMKLKAKVNPNNAVGVVIGEDGSITPVPTKFIEEDGEYIAIIKTNHNSTYTIVENEKSFSDVSNHWAKEEINFLASKLIASGMTEDNFAPNNKITRAELATIIVRSLGLEPKPTKATFSDVSTDGWYAGAVGAAVEAGIVKGYKDGTFRPDAYVTREEVTAMVVQALKLTGSDITIADEEIDQYLGQFKDQDEVNSWAQNMAAVAAKLEIVTGDSKGNFAPAQNCTRAESVVMIKKMLTAADLI